MPTFTCDTIETCQGTVCRHCLLWPDMCTCNPEHGLRQIFQGMSERISGQGWVPQTPEIPRWETLTSGNAPDEISIDLQFPDGIFTED